MTRSGCACLLTIVAVSCSGGTVPIHAQTGAPPPVVRPVVSLGGSIMEFDRGDDRAYRGLGARAGIAVSSVADVSLIGQYWPGLQGLEGRALQLEAVFLPAGRPRIAPYFLAGVGVFEATPTQGSERSAFSGAATTAGLGFHGRIAGAWGLRLEGLVRFDARSFDDELRFWLTYAPRPHPRSPRWGRTRIAPEAEVMVAITGPWRPAGPAPGLSFETPVGSRDIVTMGLSLTHLRIEQPSGVTAWDTRAVVWRSGWRRHLFGARLSIEAGPLMTMMLEGPDDGIRGGAHARMRAALRGGAPAPAVMLGAMWVVRGAADPSLSSADHRAVTLGAAVAF